jgi:hypothetical protein
MQRCTDYLNIADNRLQNLQKLYAKRQGDESLYKRATTKLKRSQFLRAQKRAPPCMRGSAVCLGFSATATEDAPALLHLLQH